MYISTSFILSMGLFAMLAIALIAYIYLAYSSHLGDIMDEALEDYEPTPPVYESLNDHFSVTPPKSPSKPL
jgi:hypothetical protein